ncbi:MAG: ABC transporter ATP-binding protein [Alphaproteobacteria bacterium]|nr:ABC transporter ATP-binding protein [Alphaproteobacteria bacterium]
MLTFRGLDAYYGRSQILFGIELDLARGDALALMGRNGAGKSTTLKCLMGLVRPVASEISLNGHDIRGMDALRISRMGVGYVPEERRIFTDLTIMENLETGRRTPPTGEQAWTPERLFELFPNLAEMKERRAGHISGGEQQMLTIARTLMGNPSLVLLDEPSEGLAPIIVDHLASVVKELKAQGLTILLSEQNLRFARQIADHVAVIETGHIRWRGAMSEFADNAELHSKFLAA